MVARPETERDVDGIGEVNIAAVQGHRFSRRREHLIVEASRAADTLEVSLVETGLDALRSRGVCGCGLVGDPAYHGRFGFGRCPGVVRHGVPDENVLCLLMSGETPTGEVAHHPALLAGV